MDLGNTGPSSNGGELNSRSTEGRIVYTRRPRKENPAPKPSAAAEDSSALASTTTTITEPPDTSTSHIPNDFVNEAKDADYSRNSSGQQAHENELDSSLHSRRLNDDSGCENAQQLHQSDEVQNLRTPSPLYGSKKLPHATFVVQEKNDQANGRVVAAERGDELLQVSSRSASGNGQANHANWVVKPLVTTLVDDDKVRFYLFKETARSEIEDLQRKLEHELHRVRLLGERVEAKKVQLASSFNSSMSNSHVGNSRSHVGVEDLNTRGYSNIQSQQAVLDDVVDNRILLRMNSAVGTMGHHGLGPMGLARVNSDMGATRNLEPRSYNRQLSVSVMENNHNEFTEKEKRTPKANQFYREADFLLGNDRLPHESNKRFKANNGRRINVETDRFGFGHDKSRSQALKSCTALLQKLMKHKFGWVFNVPVDAKALGLVDYHFVIKHPMDLGTIKSRLSQNCYNSPTEFAEDVRLVFRNAMTYNPKGQDVHLMAEELLQIFEERWSVIEAEYNPYLNYHLYQDAGLPTPTSRKVAPRSIPGFPAMVQANVPAYAAPPMSILTRTESMIARMAVDPKIQQPQSVKTPVPQKPKAKDPNKRDMTHKEKQKLSTNLQGLPAEKLDAIVQIIKRRNTALSQNGEEIEVDIDSVDTETLWELDRFVTNFKKSVSKHRKKAELQARKIANQSAAPTHTVPHVHIRSSGFEKSDEPPGVDGESKSKDGSRSSSSSSDSGSTSDSDSDSSSADGSDAGNSPKT